MKKKSYCVNLCRIIIIYNKFDTIKQDDKIMNIRSLNPAVDRKYLLLVAGLLWAAIGSLLISYAVGWLGRYEGSVFPFYSAGFLLALPVHRFGFRRIVVKNINRILPLREKRCIFSFVTWRSYGTILIMMPMGILLRHSRFPREYLAIVYLIIGFALFLSSMLYFITTLRIISDGNA